MFVLSASVFQVIVLLTVDVLLSFHRLIKTNVHMMFLQFHNDDTGKAVQRQTTLRPVL